MKVANEYDDVRILSAKYGLISPCSEIEWYDVSIYDLTDEEIEELAETIDADSLDDEIHVYAGKPYVNVVRKASKESQDVVKPLSGGYGEQLSQLNEMI